jgi:osmotically-inducible protein OsmY
MEIVNAARTMLANEPRIGAHSHKIKIGAEPDGVLVIEGEVPTIAAKKLALLAVGRIPEITGITDRLRVELSRRMTDAQIRDHLRDALLEEPACDRCAIRVWEKKECQTMRESVPGSNYWIGVSVGEGVVTLDGQVDSLSLQRLAGALAWWVPGSCDVINGLELWPPEQIATMKSPRP